jgi:hypothetical protein
MLVRILDLDSSVARQERLRQRVDHCLPLASWGPRLRLACSWRSFRAFESELSRQMGDHDRQPRLTFVGSGDFHHLSLALLRRQVGPCNVLVLDNHPDWMCRIPFLHCGAWLAHTARLPHVNRIFHVGGEVDFDNHYRWLAPWPLLRSGKITVIPALRSFRGKAWDKVAHGALRENPDEPAGRDAIEEMLAPWRLELARLPLYISLDRDVLRAEEAVVNWDSGHLVTSEVLAVVKSFLAASGGLAAMDAVGDWSPVRTSGIGRKILHWTEHPSGTIDPRQATAINERLNLTLVDTLTAAVKGRSGRTARAA